MCVWTEVKSQCYNHYHFLCLAEIDVFLILTPRLAFLNVHDSNEWHGPTPQEEDGEEHDNDGGGADKLPLLDGLQAQMKAQCIRDSTSQTYQTQKKMKELHCDMVLGEHLTERDYLSLDLMANFKMIVSHFINPEVRPYCFYLENPKVFPFCLIIMCLFTFYS